MDDRRGVRRQPEGGPAGGSRRPPGRRPISPRSPLEGRQLWRIGDWGGASEQIGRRWEALGVPCLEQLLGVARPGPDGAVYLPTGAVVLSADPALAAQVQANGKAHADAILVGAQAGRSVLEPVDFKWTLETANPRQVGAEVLGELLGEPPPLLAARLAEELDGTPSPDEPRFLDGIFLAPDHADNRAYLAPSGPLDPSWAYLCAVDPAEFFPPLPGWDVALTLARADGAYLGSLETCERYYRLGAGVLGALRRLRSSVFDDSLPDVDGPALLAQTRRERRLVTLGELIAYFDRALAARAEVADRLKEAERGAYPYARFRQDLAARGIATAGTNDRRWSRIYGSIVKTVSEDVRAEGRRLRAGGVSELDAIAQLDGQRPRWLARARALFEERIGPPPAAADALDSAPPPLSHAGEGAGG